MMMDHSVFPMHGHVAAQVYVGPLAGGKWTGILLNRSPRPANITLAFSLLNQPAAAPLLLGAGSGGDVRSSERVESPIVSALVRDIVGKRDLGQFHRSYTAWVPPTDLTLVAFLHGLKFVRLCDSLPTDFVCVCVCVCVCV
jgi:hypothetical protein